jgi:hypothetical protein
MVRHSFVERAIDWSKAWRIITLDGFPALTKSRAKDEN